MTQIDTPHPAPARSIVLIGMMGAGKTTVGRRLARHLDLRFVDADHEIESAAGMSVADIFATHGEPYFRAGEKRVIARLLDEGPCVLATGGGAWMDAETRAAVAAKGLSVWLRADVDTLVERCAGRASRPLLAQGDLRATMTRLLAQREPVYAQADVVVESGAGPHGGVVRQIIAALAAREAA